MLRTFDSHLEANSVRNQMRRNQRNWWLMYLAYLGLGAAVMLLMFRATPSPAFIAMALYVLGAAIILYNPRLGVYLMLFLTLVGDSFLITWYPFFKNLSSRESLLFIHDSLIVSPLETYIVLAFISWLGRRLPFKRAVLHHGPLFWPTMLFTGFVIFGLIFGLGTGGNVNIALWEARALFYIPALLILVTNLFTSREHMNRLVWVAVLAIFAEGVYGTIYFFTVLGGSLAGIERLTEHAASIHANSVFVFAIAAWLFRDVSWSKRLIPLLLLPPILITYLVSQRRSAFVILFVALIFLGAFMYHQRRRLFYFLAPVALVGGLLYTVVFWNVQNPLGLPAQAVKSIVAPSSASAADQQSDVYRQIENFNILITIRENPLTGVGFGQKFYMVIPLPDISFFVWWEYITHNSIVWMWMKTGMLGFISMLFLLTVSLSTGVRAVWRTRGGDYAVIGLTATVFVAMHFMYAYVDMAWDVQSMVYLGAMMGIINRIEVLLTQPVPQPPLRYPWQSAPPTPPALAPLPYDQHSDSGYAAAD